MVEPVGKIDRPEPRWQAVLALLAVGGIYVALPRALIVGPKWALPVFIVVLLAPTVVAHRTGKLSWNRTLGIIISSVITLALIASVGLLVAAVHSHKETPVELLSSGAELWLTNVLVFALWYWRLDGWRADASPANARIRQPQFRLPTDADRENRARPIRMQRMAAAFYRLPFYCAYTKLDLWSD